MVPGRPVNFRCFAIRTVHFVMHAKAGVFPGSLGFVNELFETLTLMQTGRMERVPLILFGRDFWSKAINPDFLAEQGTIAPDDVNRIAFDEAADEAWSCIAVSTRPDRTACRQFIRKDECEAGPPAPLS